MLDGVGWLWTPGVCVFLCLFVCVSRPLRHLCIGHRVESLSLSLSQQKSTNLSYQTRTISAPDATTITESQKFHLATDCVMLTCARHCCGESDEEDGIRSPPRRISAADVATSHPRSSVACYCSGERDEEHCKQGAWKADATPGQCARKQVRNHCSARPLCVPTPWNVVKLDFETKRATDMPTRRTCMFTALKSELARERELHPKELAVNNGGSEPASC